MDRTTRMLEQLTVKPGTRAALDDRDPGWTGGPDFEDLSKEDSRRSQRLCSPGESRS